MERDVVRNTPFMVVSVVTRHLCDSRPCHFAHTSHNVCCLQRTIEWFECTMHIACFHLVVTSLVCINQPWWLFHHQVSVVEHLVNVLLWCWLCLKPVITKIDEVACCCEKRLMLFESLRHGIVRICPSEPFESTNGFVSMVCARDASVEEGSAIGTSLTQHSLLECTSPVFC